MFSDIQKQIAKENLPHHQFPVHLMLVAFRILHLDAENIIPLGALPICHKPTLYPILNDQLTQNEFPNALDVCDEGFLSTRDEIFWNEAD